MSDGKDDTWVKVQQKTFTKWVNNHLRKKGFDPIGDVETEFDNGIKLMQVVSALYDLPVPKHNKNPKMRPHQLDNLQLAFNMVEEAQIKTNFLKTTHLLDHDLKMILGMLWAFILDYAIKGISVDEMTAKEGLLLWVQKKTKGYRDVDPPSVQNFHTHWKNGMAFCALIHRHRPNLIDYDSLDKNNARENLELAFDVAERELDIPRLLDVEDLTEALRPDERSVMTYVSEFFHRFAQEDMKEKGAQRVRNFIDFARKIEQEQAEYERRARALIQWSNENSQSFTEYKFGDTLDEAKSAFTSFKSFVVSTKPGQANEKLDVEALYAEIQTELLVNDRRPYECPADCTPDAIQSAWDSLQESENAHARSIRDNRFRFIKKVEYELPQEKLDEIVAAFEHFDKNKTNDLDKVEFKAALSALGVPFKDEAALNKVFNEVSQGGDRITREQYIAFNKKLLEDKDDPDQVKASFELMCDQADTITKEQLSMPPLTDEDVEYLTSRMAETAPGVYDFKSFVDGEFASSHSE